MPKTSSPKQSRSIRSSDAESALHSAQVAVAGLAATDEEFAAGTHLRNPQAILSRKRGSSKKKAIPPDAVPKILAAHKAALKQSELKMDISPATLKDQRARAEAGIREILQAKKLASSSSSKRNAS